MNFPDDTQRISIIGSTGSGKTQAALWHLSYRQFNRMPWLIYNFKHDKSIDNIPNARHIALNEVPIKPGIYVTHPKPADENEIEIQMAAIWERGNTGVYVDEGYMLGNRNQWFRALLTQGRSKQIPMIILSQRPVWMDRFVFSESEYFQVFRLQHKKDQENVKAFVPLTFTDRLPEYHSYYYDIIENKVVVLQPVPEIEHIHDTFARRLAPVRTII